MAGARALRAPLAQFASPAMKYGAPLAPLSREEEEEEVVVVVVPKAFAELLAGVVVPGPKSDMTLSSRSSRVVPSAFSRQ